MNGNLQSNVREVIQASNLALVNTEWLFSGTGPDGKPLTLMVKPQMFYVNSRRMVQTAKITTLFDDQQRVVQRCTTILKYKVSLICI